MHWQPAIQTSTVRCSARSLRAKIVQHVVSTINIKLIVAQWQKKRNKNKEKIKIKIRIKIKCKIQRMLSSHLPVNETSSISNIWVIDSKLVPVVPRELVNILLAFLFLPPSYPIAKNGLRPWKQPNERIKSESEISAGSIPIMEVSTSLFRHLN